MPEKIQIQKTIKPYSYNRGGKTVKIKSSFKRGYWTIRMTPAEKKALKEGKAQELFEKKSERAKKMDRSKTSQTVFDKPNEDWVKAMNKSDVKGIDTKEISVKKEKKESKLKELKEQIEFLENLISQFPEEKSQAQRNYEKETYEDLIKVLNKEYNYARGNERVKIKQKINKRKEELVEKEIEDAENMFLEKANNDPKKAESLKKQYLFFSEEELKEWSWRDPLSKSALILKNAPQKPRTKPKPKLKPKYLLRSRPFGIGTVPKAKEIINRESHNPLKTGNYGWVQYPNKLTFEEIWKYELVPENKVEEANYMFWVKADKDSKQAKEWKDRYLNESLETLKEMSDRDPMCKWAYTIKKASSQK